MTGTPETVEVERRLKAAAEIGGAVRARSRSAGYPVSETDSYVASDATALNGETVAAVTVDEILWDLIENGPEDPGAEDIQAILDLFLSSDEAATATLARISMRGDWNGVDEVQEILLDTASWIASRGYHVNMVWKRSPEAKLTWEVEPGLTEEPGIVAVHRKRMVLKAAGAEDDRPTFELDKLSSFALDLHLLDRVSVEAGREVRKFILFAMYAKLDMHLLAALTHNNTEILDRYDPGEIRIIQDELADIFMLADRYKVPVKGFIDLATVGDPYQLLDERTIGILEEVILEQRSSLTPAMTTFYVHNEPAAAEA